MQKEFWKSCPQKLKLKKQTNKKIFPLKPAFINH